MLDRQPHIDVQEAEYTRLLGYPRHHTMTGRARELADWARRWYAENGHPWIYARRTDALLVSDDELRIEGIAFSATRLREHLVDAQAHAVMLVAVSAGAACEERAQQLWREEKPDEYFFLEVYGSAVVEHLVTTAGARFCAWADRHGAAVLPHHSPGYTGWDVAEQRQLLGVIRAQDEARNLPEIQVLDTGMLRPKKSMLAVFGLTAQVDRVQRLTDLIPCERCSLSSCQYRRARYKNARSPLEDVSKLQVWALRNANGAASKGVSLTHDAAYSVSTKALRKWSQEHLRLTILDNRTMEAQFRYEGTTCSNLGRPLAYEYRITLDAPESGYRIVDAACAPAPGDQGHTAMCKYQKDAEALTTAIESEKPLVGKPLDEVLTWERRFSPTGCYCDAASRAHKWGLAFEVVHYALAQVEKQRLREQEEDKTMEYQP